MKRIVLPALLLSLLVPLSSASAQEFASRGFADARLFLYPQQAANDPVQVVGEALARYEPSVKLASWLRVFASFDARMDTHDQVERRWVLDWQDRGILRPPFSIRRLSAILSRGGLNLEIGKQFIRWGKADVLNPTDRFAPRDFLSVVDNEFLGVTAARLTYEVRGNTFDAVWVPRFTPSRIPLFDQRWTVLPNVGVPTAGIGPSPAVSVPSVAQTPAPLAIVDAGAQYPNGSQAGVRYNRSGAGYEFSLSFFNGFNHLPLIYASIPLSQPSLELLRTYPQMRMYGGDIALPNRWVTVNGEFAYFTSTTPQAEDYGIYVVQLERQAGEWLFVGGYAGDFVTRQASRIIASSPRAIAVPFGADRGLAEAFLGRAAVSIGTTRNLAFQAAVRQNGHGTWVKAEYSQTFGQHLRANVEGNLIRGREDDFIGQFRENSNVSIDLRYSF